MIFTDFGPICKKCGFYINHCRCPKPPGGKALEFVVATPEAKIDIPLALEPTESTPLEVYDAKEKALEIENQKFLIRMNDRIKQWEKLNGKASLPIFKDSQGKLWWANHVDRRKMAKRKRQEAKRQKRQVTKRV